MTVLVTLLVGSLVGFSVPFVWFLALVVLGREDKRATLGQMEVEKHRRDPIGPRNRSMWDTK